MTTVTWVLLILVVWAAFIGFVFWFGYRLHLLRERDEWQRHSDHGGQESSGR